MKMENSQYFQEFEWCPGAESNHRHEDFQSGAIQAKAEAYEAEARQTPDETSETYAAIVKPFTGDLTNENPGAAATATGAKDVVESVCIAPEYIATFPILATHWGALV